MYEVDTDLTTSLDPPQAVLPKSKPRTGGNEARISTAVGAPTGAAVPVRLYQAATRPLSGHRALSSAAAAAAYSVRTRDALCSSTPPRLEATATVGQIGHVRRSAKRARMATGTGKKTLGGAGTHSHAHTAHGTHGRTRAKRITLSHRRTSQPSQPTNAPALDSATTESRADRHTQQAVQAAAPGCPEPTTAPPDPAARPTQKSRPPSYR